MTSFIPIWTRARRTRAPQQWLMENSWRYGFILRYPNDSTEITGIIYEPWHYRYVGTEFAAEIMNPGLRWRNIQPGGGDAEAFPAGGRSEKRRQRRAACGAGNRLQILIFVN